MSSIPTEDSDPASVVHSDPTPHGTWFPEPGRLSVGASAEDDETRPMSPSHTLSIRSPVDFVLGNFFLATFLISLIILIASFIVTWFTVLQDARFVNDRALLNATGVRLCL